MRSVRLALLVLAVCVRGIYFLQLNATPGIELHRWDQSDMHYYDAWGRQIAQGDWLSASVGVPMHRWHHRVAESYFAAHPDARAALIERVAAPDRAKTDPDALLWSQWTGGHQFYQDPLYPYLVGLTYRLAGDDVRFVFVWQMVLGIMSTILIWWLAGRFFGQLVGLCAGLLAVLCGPLVYYELLLLRESTIVFAGLGILWLTDRALRRGSPASFALLGVSLGVACLLKSSLLLLAGGVVLGMALQGRAERRAWRVPAAAMLAGFAVALVPLAVRNVAVGVPPLTLAGSGGLTLLISNDVAYDPATGFDIDAPRLAERMGATGGGLLSSASAVLGAHSVPSYARLLIKKWDRAWYWFEIPNNENFYYTRLRAPMLAWLPVTFWLVAPAALVGLVLSVRRLWNLWPLYVLTASVAAPLVIFYTLGRFRVALVAAVVPFAAFTLVEVCRAAVDRKYARLGAIALSILIVGNWTGRPLEGQPLISSTYWLGPFYAKYEGDARAAEDANDPARAASAYLAFFQYEPALAQIAAPADADTVKVIAVMHAQCAAFLRASGRSEEARVQTDKSRAMLQHLLQMNPSNADVRVLFADTLFDDQSFPEASAAYKEYLDVRPDDLVAVIRHAIALLGTGSVDAALAGFHRAETLDPQNAQAQWYLTIVLLSRHDVEAAAEHASRYVALLPQDPAAHDLLGRVRATQGRLQEAGAQFEQALRIDPTYQDAREHLNMIRR